MAACVFLFPSARCLFDEPLQVTMTRLKPNQEVELRASATDEKGKCFRSWAVYRADHAGQVDLSRDAPLRGSYRGVQPMGLLCSITSEVSHKYFLKTQALSPHQVNLSVHDRDLLLTQETNHRCILGNGVQRQTVTEAGFTGVLFTPPGPGPFAALLDLCTFLSEKRACLLANKGFVVLSLSLYSDPKVDRDTELHLDQYEEAVLYLLRHAKVGSAEVGVVARSKAADVALSLAAFVRGVGAVVWINGCCANVEVPLFYRQRQLLPALRPDMSKIIKTDSGAYLLKPATPIPCSEAHLQTVIPIEKASAQLLFVASGDDLHWDSAAFMEQMVERLKLHGKNNYEAILYPGAGHLLEPPFSPFIVSSFHGVAKTAVLWGGEASAHVAAEEHLWKKIQEFFRANLKCDANQAKVN
uniref:Acyl-coenzyme A thioesterase 1-like n=1 Tax=Periophthalmus magnuspinnatus TaxID=409849 RepID=A0A3B3ZLX3_9GOBI